jgi:hypothetical protein
VQCEVIVTDRLRATSLWWDDHVVVFVDGRRTCVLISPFLGIIHLLLAGVVCARSADLATYLPNTYFEKLNIMQSTF